MNKDKLKSVIALNGDTQGSLSSVIGITPQRFSSKINGKKGAEFTQSEIKEIKKRYKLTAQEIDNIFFADFVSLKDTKISA
ncbi:XRE family transcriptional regulator [Enterococcus rotai]|uniref:XRE family transcriptional regulator n=1 Tax=Enterococcus rotai TaxID=118060 RepID=UPI0032B5906E